MIDLDAIEARAKAANLGPTRVERDDMESGAIDWIVMEQGGDRDGSDAIIAGIDAENTTRAKAKAEFIAHARTDVPALVARVRELEAQAAEHQAAILALAETYNARDAQVAARVAELEADKVALNHAVTDAYADGHDAGDRARFDWCGRDLRRALDLPDDVGDWGSLISDARQNATERTSALDAFHRCRIGRIERDGMAAELAELRAIITACAPYVGDGIYIYRDAEAVALHDRIEAMRAADKARGAQS